MFAAVPKPLLVPFVAWVVLRRRPMIGSMVVGALVATAIATAVTGPGRVIDYVRALSAFAGGRMDFMGNAGVTASLPGWLIVVVSAATIALLVLLLLNADDGTAAVGATIAGLILTPYSGFNLAVVVLPPLSLYARTRPVRAALVALCCVALPFGL